MINERFNIAYEQLFGFIAEQKKYAQGANEQFGEGNPFAVVVTLEAKAAIQVAQSLIWCGNELEKNIHRYPNQKGRADAYVMHVAKTLDDLEKHHKANLEAVLDAVKKG
jgi:hypothetical protein